jgi:putative acetyltransferase
LAGTGAVTANLQSAAARVRWITHRHSACEVIEGPTVAAGRRAAIDISLPIKRNHVLSQGGISGTRSWYHRLMVQAAIREYRESDLNAVLDVWMRASQLAHQFLSADFLARESQIIREVLLPVTETWVYEEGGGLLGFVALIGNEVGAIFVAPEHMRRGIGRALMDKAVGMHGVVELDVFAANSIGRSFYRRYGFVEVGQSMHEETGETMLRLRYPFST